jgi:hypothetical protein
LDNGRALNRWLPNLPILFSGNEIAATPGREGRMTLDFGIGYGFVVFCHMDVETAMKGVDIVHT